jgi:hypothetical protein
MQNIDKVDFRRYIQFWDSGTPKYPYGYNPANMLAYSLCIIKISEAFQDSGYEPEGSGGSTVILNIRLKKNILGEVVDIPVEEQLFIDIYDARPFNLMALSPDEMRSIVTWTLDWTTGEPIKENFPLPANPFSLIRQTETQFAEIIEIEAAAIIAAGYERPDKQANLSWARTLGLVVLGGGIFIGVIYLLGKVLPPMMGAMSSKMGGGKPF